MQKKKQPWVRWRHKLVTAILRPFLGLYTRWKYGIDVTPFREEKGRQYLVMMNHQTAFDQFFISIAFHRPVYFIASEDLFSMGWLSRALEWLVAPIPIKKQTTDLRATRICMQVAKEGGTICLSPEGNRTFSGRTGYFNPAIVKLARMLKLPVAIFRIEGGYGVHPRWSDVVRRGKMRGYVSRVIEPEEYLQLTAEDFHALLTRELWVDEANAHHEFHHPQLAQYLERAVYVCPHCGLSTFHSQGDTIRCTRCGLAARYLPTTELQSVTEEPFPFPFVAQWYDYQEQFINALDLSPYTQEPLYRDRVSMRKVHFYKNKEVLFQDTELRLYGDRMEVGDGEIPDYIFPFATTGTVTVLGKNKINLYTGDELYQFWGDARFNALRHVNIFYRWQNVHKGAEYEFLGL